jgi:hypothetical protein
VRVEEQCDAGTALATHLTTYQIANVDEIVGTRFTTVDEASRQCSVIETLQGTLQ